VCRFLAGTTPCAGDPRRAAGHITRHDTEDTTVSSSIAVVGAGLMGSGIAQVSAAAGHDVVLRDVTDAALTRGLNGIRDSYARFVSKGRMTQDEMDAALARITTTTDLGAASGADIIVEAVFEQLEIKEAVFRELDKIAKPGAVLATNTSAIPITRIAAVTERPEDVVGVHFFSPVPMMQLVELVRGYKTSDAALATARTFAESVGKTCVVVNRDVAGFVTTRLITALVVEAVKLYESGVASAEDIDTACRLGFGHAMGPLATADLTGVDILLHAAHNIYSETQDTKFAAPEIMARMVTAGDLGRKSGQGFYHYGEK
jgi:3-hydroxybutyryl-CoA dehydrogenase